MKYLVCFNGKICGLVEADSGEEVRQKLGCRDYPPVDPPGGGFHNCGGYFHWLPLEKLPVISSSDQAVELAEKVRRN